MQGDLSSTTVDMVVMEILKLKKETGALRQMMRMGPELYTLD